MAFPILFILLTSSLLGKAGASSSAAKGKQKRHQLSITDKKWICARHDRLAESYEVLGKAFSQDCNLDQPLAKGTVAGIIKEKAKCIKYNCLTAIHLSKHFDLALLKHKTLTNEELCKI